MSPSNGDVEPPTEPWLRGPVALYTGDAHATLTTMPDASVDCVVSSPPYWHLRDYHTGHWVEGDDTCDHHASNGPLRPGSRCPACGASWADSQVGQETTIDAYIRRLVAVFAEVHRVLQPRGTVWLNLGDGYSGTGPSRTDPPGATSATSANYGRHRRSIGRVNGLAPKNLIGLPWTIAFALRESGLWVLRNAIVWAKTNGQPSSVRDRLTNAHEFVFLLTRSRRYHFDLDAIRVPWQTSHHTARTGSEQTSEVVAGKNPGDVWNMPTRAVREAHFASFPADLPRRCIAAGCPPGGHVLDPFSGTATTGLAALDLGRRYTGIDLNSDYTAIARRRLASHLDQLGSGRDG